MSCPGRFCSWVEFNRLRFINTSWGWHSNPSEMTASDRLSLSERRTVKCECVCVEFLFQRLNGGVYILVSFKIIWCSVVLHPLISMIFCPVVLTLVLPPVCICGFSHLFQGENGASDHLANTALLINRIWGITLWFLFQPSVLLSVCAVVSAHCVFSSLCLLLSLGGELVLRQHRLLWHNFAVWRRFSEAALGLFLLHTHTHSHTCGLFSHSCLQSCVTRGDEQ